VAFPKKLLSIDIGAEQIKIVNIAKKGKIVVNNSIILDTPYNSMDDGTILNQQAIVEVIREQLDINNIKTKDVIFTLSCSKIITREVEYPKVKGKKLDAIINMSASDHFPINLSEYNLAYYVRKKDKEENSNKIKVVIYAILSELVDDYITLAYKLNLNIICIDYAGNSIVNFAKNENIKGTNLFIELNRLNTMVTVISNGKEKFNRNLTYGMKVVTEAIMNHYAVGYEEAKAIGGSVLLDSEEFDDQYLNNDITGVISEILAGISKLINYYYSRNQESIETIYILGEGSKTIGIEQVCQDYFNIETKIFTNYKEVDYKELEEDDITRSYFVNAIGASFANINLLPKNIREKDKIKSLRRVKYELIILVFLLIGLLVYFKYNEVQDLEAKKERLVNQVEIGRSISEVKKEYEQLMAKNNFRQSILDYSNLYTSYFLEIINIMEDTMPEDVFYFDINSTDTEIIINCIGKDKMTVAKFIETMKNLTYNDGNLKFSKVFVPEVMETTISSDKKYFAFTMTCYY
jgi:type IV pilus assembly protein PilM